MADVKFFSRRNQAVRRLAPRIFPVAGDDAACKVFQKVVGGKITRAKYLPIVIAIAMEFETMDGLLDGLSLSMPVDLQMNSRSMLI